jgi:HlyD family secretion protein
MTPRDSNPQRSIRVHLIGIVVAIIALVGGIVVMSILIELSGAVVATGTLVVESNVKKVQHPTGGIVAELLVRNGSRVEAGDLLIRLDDTAARANAAMITKSLNELAARQARLETERDGEEQLRFPDELLKVAGDAELDRVIKGEQKLFQLRRQAQQGQKSQLRERISQRRSTGPERSACRQEE